MKQCLGVCTFTVTVIQDRVGKIWKIQDLAGKIWKIQDRAVRFGKFKIVPARFGKFEISPATFAVCALILQTKSFLPSTLSFVNKTTQKQGKAR